MIRQMADGDFEWAAGVMERRRTLYEAFSPVFWRPAEGAAAFHAEFMRSLAARDGAVAVRSEHGFALSIPQNGRCFLDDFAVEDDHRWATDGLQLLRAVWSRRPHDQTTLRVVTARLDHAKRDLLVSSGLHGAERWWVKELQPTAETPTWGPVDAAGIDAAIVPAPPVYNPGGPVCLLGNADGSRAGEAALAAAGMGAVLAIVQRQDPAPSEPMLEDAGFHNASEFFEGDPVAALTSL